MISSLYCIFTITDESFIKKKKSSLLFSVGTVCKHAPEGGFPTHNSQQSEHENEYVKNGSKFMGYLDRNFFRKKMGGDLFSKLIRGFLGCF